MAEPTVNPENRGRPDNRGLLARLARTRTATKTVIVLERLWPLILPLIVVISLFLAASWFGLFRIAPDWARLALAGLFAVAGLGTLFPLTRFRAPTPFEIDRRIERTNRLEHAPVSVQTDRLAGGDFFADALWREHQKRMAERLGTLESGLPRTRVPERDPWGLRAVAALLLVVGFAFSFGPLGGRIGDAFRPAALNDTVPPRIDAWVTPPPYTGRAPLFLTAEANRAEQLFTVPAGSELTLRITGGSGAETLDFTDDSGVVQAIAPKEQKDETAEAPAAAAARQFASTLRTAGILSLRSGGSDVQSWKFAVIPDKPPLIRFAGEPKRAVNGTLELAYRIEDDYGAAKAEALIEQTEAPAKGARPLFEAPEMPLSLPARGAKGEAKTSRDITEHPWAGAKARLTLSATDAAGQTARSETKTLVLPERPFTNPLAKAVVEQRRILALDANQKRHVLDLMDAITLRPEDTFSNMAHYLALMSARTRLDMAESDDQLRDVVGYLWQIALGIEDGDLSAAEKRLRQAQEALKQALKDGATDDEIDKLMKELREAMQEFMRELAERAAKNPNMAQQMPPDAQMLTQNDLEKMLDQIENLAKSGSRDKAEELLSQLQDMMNNLQTARRGQQGQNGQQSQMRQQMNKLGEIMRRQQQMMNETFRLDQMQRGEQGQQGEQQPGQDGQQGQNGQQQGQNGMTADQLREALRQLQEGQGQLKGDLEGLMKGLEGMGMKPSPDFGDAGKSMGRAGDALGQGDGEQAVGEQGQALEALRRGAQDMMQQMQQAQRGEQGGSQEGGRQQNADRDPLGRPRATTGPDFGNSVKVPDEIDVQRARQILEAIRKRLGNALSPELEKQYLERLLELK